VRGRYRTSPRRPAPAVVSATPGAAIIFDARTSQRRDSRGWIPPCLVPYLARAVCVGCTPSAERIKDAYNFALPGNLRRQRESMPGPAGGGGRGTDDDCTADNYAWVVRGTLRDRWRATQNKTTNSYVIKIAIFLSEARPWCRVRVRNSSGRRQRYCGFAALVAGGGSVHFFQDVAQGIELRAETFPVSSLQSLHRLIVAIERLLRLACRRACRRHLFPCA
jgi:hypothetical protein